MSEVKQFSHGYLSLDSTKVGDSETPILDFLKDPRDAEAFEKQLMDRDLTGKLIGLLGTLDPRDAKILSWRYGLDGQGSRTLDEIGKSLSIFQGAGSPNRGARHAQNPRGGRRGRAAGLCQLNRVLEKCYTLSAAPGS